jgi:hypothetical protein
MVKQIIDLKDGENDKVEKLAKHWGLNKQDTILRIIKLFPEEFIPDLIELDADIL